MQDPSSFRPKLKQDSIFLPTDDGVLFTNGSTVFFLKGKSSYRWVGALAPHLTGEQTLESLCSSLEPQQREMVMRIVQMLYEKGFIKNHLLEDPAILPEVVRIQFKSQIEFIDHYADRPLQRFKNFRQSRILMIGSGFSFRSLAVCLLRNGVEKLFLSPTEYPYEDMQEVEVELASLNQTGVEASLNLVKHAKGLSAVLSDFEMVVYCSDKACLQDVRFLNSHCQRESLVFLPGIILGDQSIIGPIVRPGAAGCWLCGIMRLCCNMSSGRSEAFWKELALGCELLGERCALSVPTAKMLGNNTAFEIFKALGGHLPPESEGGLLIQNLDSLESSRSPFLPHPLCPVCSSINSETELSRLYDIAQGRRDCNLTIEEQLKRFNSLIDSRSGIIRGFTDEELARPPIRTTMLLMEPPVDPAAGCLRISAHSDESIAQARHRALLEAIKQYVAALPDTRGMVSGSFQELVERDMNPVASQDISIWSGGPDLAKDSHTKWLPAYGLFAERVHYVPAASVYPFSRLNSPGVFEQTSSGSAIATTFEAALLEGILSALCYERMRDVLRGRSLVFSLDLQILSAMDNGLASLIEVLLGFDSSIRVLEFAGHSPVRVVWASAGEGPSNKHIFRIGTGLSRREAAKQALVALAGVLLNRHSREDMLDSMKLHFPGFSLPPDLIAASLGESCYLEPSATNEQVESFLQSANRDALFVNTTTSDIWGIDTVIVGKVLVAERQKAGESG